MAAYNFQKVFAPLVKEGHKRSTIRARRANGYVPSVGERIKLYTGMRSRACRLLREVEVTHVRPVKIMQGDGRVEVFIDAVRLPRDAVLELAKSDGFESVYDFGRFFAEAHGLEFNGYLIEWRVQ